MARRGSRDLAVGTVFALALTILALAVMAVGGEVPGFSNRISFRSVFPNAEGLLPGAPVRMAGVEIGTVGNIRLPRDPSVAGIEVQLLISRDYVPRVRQDSSAALRILQLLTSEKYVEVFPGSPDQPQLAENDLLPIRRDTGILEQGEAIAENVIDITAALKRILEPMERGEGLLGRIIQDPEFGMQGVEAFGGALENMELLTRDLREGKGLVGRLLYDEELATRLDGLADSMDALGEIVAVVAEQKGVLEDFLAEGGTGQQTLHDLRDAAGSLKRLTERLESEDSLLAQFIDGGECVQSVSTNICETMANLAEVTDKLNRGEGTLGALINDRTLYDGAEDLVAGTNDSKFARWLLRHYRKRGVEAQESDTSEEAESGPPGG